MSLRFSYTGSNQSWTVPTGVTTISVAMHGASGGMGSQNIPPQGEGGLSGLLYATFDVTPGEVLTLVIGGTGATNVTSGISWNGGGFNGGGAGGGLYGGGGGGATDIRRTGTALTDRILVAGGGGGGGGGESNDPGGQGGAGGGTTGGTGSSANTSNFPGNGGTQSAGGTITGNLGSNAAGTLGLGGQGGSRSSFYGGGGGGGGYYGGGGGGAGGGTTRGDGGGGGSNFAFAGARGVAHIQGVNARLNGYIWIAFLYPGTVLGGGYG